jgi:hypothetical protein
MLASPSPGAKSRLARARAVASRLRAAVPDVPAGLSGLTDRVLPYVFPTIDRAVFEETLRDSVVPEAPPPDEVNAVATSFAPLATLGENGFFARAATRRTCLLVTDGESRGATADQGGDDAGTPALGGSLGGDSGASGESVGDPGCRLIVVRVGDSGDRIYGEDGRVEAEYRPVAGAADTLRALAEDAGGRAFSEASLEAAAGALRTAAEFGPVRATVVRPAVRAIAPFLVVLAGVLALLVVAVRLPETLRSQAAQDYHPLHVLRPKKGRI